MEDPTKEKEFLFLVIMANEGFSLGRKLRRYRNGRSASKWPMWNIVTKDKPMPRRRNTESITRGKALQ